MNTFRAVVSGLAVSAAILLSGCKASRLDDTAAREFIKEYDRATETLDRAVVEPLLAPEFAATIVIRDHDTVVTRAEFLDGLAKMGFDPNRVAKLSVNEVTLDASATRATVTGVADNTYVANTPPFSGQKIHEVVDHTFVVEIRDGKTMLVSDEGRVTSLEVDGRKVF